MSILSRYRTVLVLLCGGVVLYALLGFVALPYAIKTYGIPALAERLHHPVVAGDIRFNPFTFSLTLSSFEIREPDHTPMLGFQELFVNFEGTSVFRSAFLFDEIRLSLPFGLVHVQADGHVNLLELFPPAAEKPDVPAPSPGANAEKKPLPPVQVRLLSIRQGAIEFRDDTKRKPVSIDIVPIEITLQNFSTRRGGENAYAFTAEFGEGQSLDWEGDIYLDPLESSGRISLSNVKLNTFWPSVRDRFHFDILDGAVTVDARYHVDITRTPINFLLSDGKVLLSDFRLAATGERDPVMTVSSLALDGIHVDLPKQELGVQTIRVTGVDLRTWLAQDGVVNFKPLFAPVAKDEIPEPPAAKPARPWAVYVNKVELSKTHISFEDRSLAIPASLVIDDMNVTVDDIQIPFKGRLPIRADLRLNRQGTIEAKGTVQVDPPQADVTLALAHISLTPFQSYVDRAAHVEVKNGELELAGEVHYRSRTGSEPMLRYTGKVNVNNLHLADRAAQQEFLGWTALGLNNVELAVLPTRVKVGEIALRDPSARFVITKDGSNNIARALRAPGQDTAQQAAPPAVKSVGNKEAPPTPITIDLVTLSKLSATFVDESIEPTVTTGIQGLSGTIKGLSSKQLAKATVSLAGKVDKARSRIQGQINPLSEEAFTNLKFIFQGVDLTAVSPYAGKYAGYPITKGKLSLDLTYQVSKKQLVGENKVLIDQFTFGEETQSPDATGLPVRLAVALLKDRRGMIDIDMPV
ncbi:MAG: DUF748 domain-containing protein [Nitrospira sp.]